jgi:hypothetical protein
MEKDSSEPYESALLQFGTVCYGPNPERMWTIYIMPNGEVYFVKGLGGEIKKLKSITVQDVRDIEDYIDRYLFRDDQLDMILDVQQVVINYKGKNLEFAYGFGTTWENPKASALAIMAAGAVEKANLGLYLRSNLDDDIDEPEIE